MTLCDKLNQEVGCPVVPLKTKYTSGIVGLNVSNCYTPLLELIDKVSDSDEPINTSMLYSVDDVFNFIQGEYPGIVEHCQEININDPKEIINVADAFENLHLTRIQDTVTGELTGYIVPEGVDIL